jgi:hypothetical protein
MSKYQVFSDIIFKDRRLLLAALAQLGYSEVEEGEALPRATVVPKPPR